MEKLGYQFKTLFSKINTYFHSTEFLKIYDKVVKFLKMLIPRIAIYFTLVAFCYVFMYPILRVLVDSVKTEADIVNPDVVWVPTAITGSNYQNAAQALWIYKQPTGLEGAWLSTLLNSVFFSTLSAIFQTFVSCLAGYAFARFNFKGKKLWFAGLIMAFIIPVQLLTLPRSMMLRPLINRCSSASALFGLPETTQTLHIDGIFSVVTTLPSLLITMLGQGLNSSILIFIFFSFFKMIPSALDEAAQIDGANFLQIFYHIIIKMSIPTILVVFLFSFIWNWNDTYVLGKLTAISSNNLAFRSLPQALGQFNYVISQGQSSSGVSGDVKNNAGLKSAGILISILPLIVLYAFTQRKFVEGIENTGVTGV